MAPKSAPLVLAILSVMAVVALAVGGYGPIQNLKDPKVIEIAKFAVAEHNKETSASLAFVSVLKGEKQVVSGVNYRLVIAAKDADVVSTNIALVFAPLGTKPLKLVSFVPQNS